MWVGDAYWPGADEAIVVTLSYTDITRFAPLARPRRTPGRSQTNESATPPFETECWSPRPPSTPNQTTRGRGIPIGPSRRHRGQPRRPGPGPHADGRARPHRPPPWRPARCAPDSRRNVAVAWLLDARKDMPVGAVLPGIGTGARPISGPAAIAFHEQDTAVKSSESGGFPSQRQRARGLSLPPSGRIIGMSSADGDPVVAQAREFLKMLTIDAGANRARSMASSLSNSASCSRTASRTTGGPAKRSRAMNAKWSRRLAGPGKPCRRAVSARELSRRRGQPCRRACRGGSGQVSANSDLA